MHYLERLRKTELMGKMRLIYPWVVTVMFRNFVLSFVVIAKSRRFSPNEVALSCQEIDNLFRGRLSESSVISRRELLAWGPILAGVISADANAGSVSAEPSLEPPPKFQAPFSSTRKYKLIKLKNELKVLLVSDKQAVRAATALAIDGAGQFSDPEELPGCAHLMEHMILSSASSSRFRKSVDFEDWLSDVEGASNAFTGYEEVCFHFTSPPGVLMEALTRFSSLFNEPDVIKICQNEEILKREIRRVSSELDFENENMQAFYVVKDMMNPGHPYSRFARGNIESLERKPREDGLNVPEILFNFFREHYQSTSASLVVVAPFDLVTLERWVAPFNSILSRERRGESRKGRIFPKETLIADKRSRQVLLYRPKTEVPLKENIELLSMHWTLDLNYNEPIKSWRNVVTASQVGFVLSQIFGRRGPGSLYYILSRRGWVPEGRRGVPRISFPVDVFGFQLMKLEFSLTLDGFANRAVAVAYIYRTINSVFSGESMTRFLVSRQILLQYAVVAELHGYILAPRPPDAVELAVDEGLKNEKNFDPSEWNRFPAVNNLWGIALLQRAVKDTLIKMSDPSSAIIITTATDKALAKAKQNSFSASNAFLVGDAVPAPPPSNWSPEKITGAKYYRDDILRFTGPLGDLFTANTEEEELLPPLTNNLIPSTIRPPRVALHQLYNVNEGRNKNWRILQPGPYTLRLRIPRTAPEPSCRCTFVFQLLSPRPARANTRQAAYAELWKVSFEKSVADLAELGVPAGLAYDMSFNKFGVRLCFLGISQSIASYSRRFCRRLAQYHRELLEGPEELPKSIKDAAAYDAMRTPGLSAVRKREIQRVLQEATAYETATEAIAFFKSCTGGCGFSEGDLLASETSALFNDLQGIFKKELGSLGKKERPTLIPSIDDLSYSPVWKPRFASSCNVPGVQFVSDACGRVPR